MICPYCNSAAELKDSSVIYGKSYGPAWICSRYPACDSYCGCHKGTEKPLGTLADRETREWRKRVHALIDPLWGRNTKYKSNRTRGRIYNRIADRLGVQQFHTGESSAEVCRQVVEMVSADRKAFYDANAPRMDQVQP